MTFRIRRAIGWGGSVAPSGVHRGVKRCIERRFPLRPAPSQAGGPSPEARIKGHDLWLTEDECPPGFEVRGGRVLRQRRRWKRVEGAMRHCRGHFGKCLLGSFPPTLVDFFFLSLFVRLCLPLRETEKERKKAEIESYGRSPMSQSIGRMRWVWVGGGDRL